MAKTADYDLGEFTFPRGWFMIARADEVSKKPLNLRYFGQDMVLYRGDSGRLVLMDAYCPHMGTHIGQNETSYVVMDNEHVDGDNIRCPYHGWQFGPDGKCIEIPYSPAPIPASACIRTYPVQEWGGSVLMWHDTEQGEPNFDPPELPQWEDPSWVNWKIDDLGELNQHPMEVIDNMADKAHLGPIHGSTNMEYFENEFNDHVLVQRLAAGHRTMSEAQMINDTWYTGPGILLSKIEGDYPSMMMISNTPIEDGLIRVFYGILVKGKNEIANEEDQAVADEYHEVSKAAFLQDFEIWFNKRPCLNVLQVIGDGPFGKTRIWYKQFYNPRDKVKDYQDQVNGVVVTKGTNRDNFEKTAAE